MLRVTCCLAPMLVAGCASAPAPALAPMAPAPSTAPPAASSAAAASAESDAPPEARAWIDAENKRIALEETLIQNGAHSSFDLVAVSKEWLRAVRESGAQGAELVSAAEKHRDRALHARDLLKTRPRGGGAELLAAEADLAEAEYWVAWAKRASN